jgi:hypothetical protein
MSVSDVFRFFFTHLSLFSFFLCSIKAPKLIKMIIAQIAKTVKFIKGDLPCSIALIPLLNPRIAIMAKGRLVA